MPMKFLSLILAAAALQLLTGCETTGNPNEGGIFWSERKAQERLDSRESQLSRTERSTARQSSAAERRRQMLGE